MRSNRPPHRSTAFRWAALLMLLSPGGLYGQDLILPDLFLPLGSRPDLVQPAEYPDVTLLWTTSPLTHRRIYPLEIVSLSPAMHPVEDGMDIVSSEKLPPTGDAVPQEIDLPEPADYEKSYGYWNAAAGVDLREGGDVSVTRNLGKAWRAGVEGFFPLSPESPRPASAGISGERRGPLSAELEAALLFNDAATAYGRADLDWDSGLGAPDSHRFQSLVLGGPDGGGSADFRTKLRFEPGKSNWIMGGTMGAGTGYSGGDWQWNLDGALGMGYRWPEKGVRLMAGAHMVFQGEPAPDFAPYLELVWKSGSTWSASLRGDWQIGADESLPEVLRYQDVDAWDGSIPVNMSYRANGTWRKPGGFGLQLEFEGAFGSFSFADNSEIALQDDLYLRGLAAVHLPAGSGLLIFDGETGYYFTEELMIWAVSAAFRLDRLEISVKGGSEDEFLGGGLPGIRGDNPIIGVGTDWEISSRWSAEMLAYTRIPWNRPSVELRAQWRSE